MRFYLTELGLYNDGNGDYFAPVVSDYVQNYRCVDARADPTQITGYMLAECWPSAAEHSAMSADPQITYIPIELAGGAEVSLDTLVTDLPQYSTVQSFLESQGIALQTVTTLTTVQELLVIIIKNLCIRQILAADDIVTSLDTTVGETELTNAKARLQGLGFNTNISGTKRDFVNHMIAQNNKFLKTHYG